MDKVDSSEVVVIVVVDRLAHVRRLSFDVRVGQSTGCRHA